MPDSEVTQKEVSQILRSWNEIPILEVLFVIAVGIAVAVLIRLLVPRIADRLPDRFRFWVLPWEPILRVLVLFVSFSYVFPLVIHPTPENLFAVLGTLAVALGFAFKDYASSLLAGIVALYERPYRSGDWVRIEDVYGEVQSLDLRTLQVLTPNDTIVAVPHNKIWTTPIWNSNRGHRDLMCVADFYLHPEHDAERVRDSLYDVATSSPFLNFRRAIVVVVAERPWGTHYQLKAYPIDGRDQFWFISDLTIRGKAMLRRQGITLATVPMSVPVG